MEETASTYMQNKESQIADKGWSSSVGIGRGPTTRHYINQRVNDMLHKVSDFDEGPVVVFCEHGNELLGVIIGGEFLDYLSDY
jgi:hypothetical protein